MFLNQIAQVATNYNRDTQKAWQLRRIKPQILNQLQDADFGIHGFRDFNPKPCTFIEPEEIKIVTQLLQKYLPKDLCDLVIKYAQYVFTFYAGTIKDGPGTFIQVLPRDAKICSTAEQKLAEGVCYLEDLKPAQCNLNEFMEVLEEFRAYLEHHKGVEPPIIPKPLRSKEMKQVCSDPWDAAYIDRIGDNRKLLYDMILFANRIGCQSLLHLGCAKVAAFIKGKPLEDIKPTLTKGMIPSSSSATSDSSAGLSWNLYKLKAAWNLN